MKLVKPSSPAEKATKTTTDTVLLTKQTVAQWMTPPFQREVRINSKVQGLVDEIRGNGGVIPGVITLGLLDGALYRIDGQHRLEAWKMAELAEGYADVRTIFCASMGEMAAEFVRLNSRLVTMRPDDILRGLESVLEPLRRLRGKCRFVGYDFIRRGTTGPIVSMSLALRVWRGSSFDVPTTSGGGVGAAGIAETLTTEETDQMSAFLNICFHAWGRDQEYARLWGSLNLILCAWLYRRVVLTRYSAKTPQVSAETFGKCLMSVSADKHYVDWLVGRNLGERDRSPGYQRLKSIFAARIMEESGKRPSLPAPDWANG